MRKLVFLFAVLAGALIAGCAAGPVADNDPSSPMVKKMASGAQAIRAANLYDPGELVKEPDPGLKLSGAPERRFAEVVYGGKPNAMSLEEMRRYRDLYGPHLRRVDAVVERGQKVMSRLRYAHMSGVYTVDRPQDVERMVKEWNRFLEAQAAYTGPLVRFTALMGRAANAAQDSLVAAIDYREGKASRAAYEEQVGRAGKLILATQKDYRLLSSAQKRQLMRAARRADRAFRASGRTGAINDALQERFGANLALPGQDPG